VESRSERAPEFVRSDPLLRDAFELARAAHHGPRRQGETDVDHPVSVAELLASRGYDREVVAAALLHDVVEDTDTDLPELAQRFGAEICELVREMTEDASIPNTRIARPSTGVGWRDPTESRRSTPPTSWRTFAVYTTRSRFQTKSSRTIPRP
jgi:(p)ppGpp synthase/HD superfamily hydrolase